LLTWDFEVPGAEGLCQHDHLIIINFDVLADIDVSSMIGKINISLGQTSPDRDLGRIEYLK
jgi:hypothetical protein